MSRRRIFVLTAVILGVSSVAARECRGGAEESSAAATKIDAEGMVLQQRIVAGIRENYRRIPQLRCKMRMTSINPKVKERN